MVGFLFYFFYNGGCSSGQGQVGTSSWWLAHFGANGGCNSGQGQVGHSSLWLAHFGGNGGCSSCYSYGGCISWDGSRRPLHAGACGRSGWLRRRGEQGFGEWVPTTFRQAQGLPPLFTVMGGKSVRMGGGTHACYDCPRLTPRRSLRWW